MEYKHGSVREEHSYFVQLCAQAMCLEEMFSTNIPCGALFFISAHRRKEVEFSAQLRAGVREQAELLKKLWDRHIVPPAEYGPKCKRCSIQEYCMPKINRSAKAYCKNLVEAATKVEMP